MKRTSLSSTRKRASVKNKTPKTKKGSTTTTSKKKKSNSKKGPDRYEMYNRIKATLSEAMMESYKQMEEERLSKSLVDVPRLNIPDKLSQYDKSKKSLDTKNGEFLCDICKQPVEIRNKSFVHRCKSKYLKYTNSPSYDKRVSIVKSYLSPTPSSPASKPRTPQRRSRGHPPRPSSQLSNISLTSPPKPLNISHSKSSLYNHSMDHILKQLEKKGKNKRMERRPICFFMDEEEYVDRQIQQEIQPLYSEEKSSEKHLTPEERRRARKLAARWMAKVNSYLTLQAQKIEKDKRKKKSRMVRESARRRAIRREYESMVIRSIYNHRQNQLTPTQERRLHQRLPCGLTYAQIRELQSRELTPEDYSMLLTLDETVQKKTVPKEIIDSFPVIYDSNVECLICMNALDDDEVALLSEPIYEDEDDEPENSDKLPSTTTLHQYRMAQPQPEPDDFQVHEADSTSSSTSSSSSTSVTITKNPLSPTLENNSSLPLIQLPCSHKFHQLCITNWLTNQSINCPLCKNVVHEGLL